MPTIEYIPSLSGFGCHVIGWWDSHAGKWRITSTWATEADAKQAARAVYQTDMPPESARACTPASK